MKRSYKIIVLFVVLVACLLGLASASFSQTPLVWTNLGLYGGQIYDIAVDPSNPDKMFAASYFGDGLFVTEDGGGTWRPVETENEPEGEGTFKNHVVYAVKIAPTNNNVIWVAHDYWVEKSTDGGRTWTHIWNSAMQRDCQDCGGDGDNFRFCKSAAIDPTNPDIVYVGTSGPYGAASQGAIYKTTDGGKTWAKMNQGADLDHSVVDMDIDPHNSHVIWAVTNSLGVGGRNGTLYRGEIDGQGIDSWIPVFSRPNARFHDVEVKPNDSNAIFTANDLGIFRHYIEDGEWKSEWILNYSQWPPPEDEEFARFVKVLAFDPQKQDVLYAHWSYSYAGTIYTRIARGSSPYAYEDWEFYPVDYSFLALAVHPTNSELIFGGTISEGVFKSSDHGQTWTDINNGINAVIVYDVASDPNDSTHFLAGTLTGLYEKKGGGNWSRLLPYDTRSVQFHPTDSRTFYVGLIGWLVKTVDEGLTWSYTYVEGFRAYDIAIDPSNTDTVFIAAGKSGVPGRILRSTDGGASFETMLEGLNQSGETYAFNTVEIDPADGQHILAGGGNFYVPRVLGDLWESNDGGVTWIRTSLRNVIVNDLLIDPQKPGIMYAGCGYSGGTNVPVYKSTDGGATWAASHDGMPISPVGLNDVWGSSATDVFAPGSLQRRTTPIFHYDGSSWSELDSKTAEDLEGVWGSSAADVFAVGVSGTIIHYDGGNWSPMSSGTTENLNAVWGSSGADVFAVGSSGTILHYDGNTWSAMSSGKTEDLEGVWGASGTDVFVVGGGGTILRYDGTTWTAMSSGTTAYLEDVWGSSTTDVFAVGGDGTILHYDGSSWSAMGSGKTEHLEDVWGSSSTDVFAVGNDGIILHYDGNRWSEMVTDIPEEKLTGVWGSSGTDVFAVGELGGIYHYSRGGWSVMRPAGRNWNSVTDLEFHRQNSNVVYASTFLVGVYVSPNQAGRWLNLGTPDYAVYAISTSSLYAATQGGLLQCTGTGVIAGKLTDAQSRTAIDSATVFTDFGVKTVCYRGEYMMVSPAGIFNVTAIADDHANMTMLDVKVLGGDISWAHMAMQRGVADAAATSDGGGGGGDGGGSSGYG